jgi:hypothetical protein
MKVHSSRVREYNVANGFQIWLCPVVLMLIIVGCTGPMEVQQSNALPAAITSFDGLYRTTIRVTGTAGGAKGKNWCESPGQPVITVSGGHFSYAIPHPNVPGNPTPTFRASMAEDGSFAGQANNGTIAGQVRGPYIEGTVNGAGCLYAFSGTRT